MRKKNKRALERKTTDAVVDKILVDNFKEKTQMEVDGLLVDGKTLRNRLLEDRRQHNSAPRSLPMGGPYYKKLKGLYCSEDSPFRSLKVHDDTVAIDESLIEALLALKGPEKHRGFWLTGSAQPPSATRASSSGCSRLLSTTIHKAAPTRCMSWWMS